MLRFIASALILSILITRPAFSFAEVTQAFPPQPPPTQPSPNTTTVEPSSTVLPNITTTAVPHNITTITPLPTTPNTTTVPPNTTTTQPPPKPSPPKPGPSPNITTTPASTPMTSEPPTTVSTTPMYISTVKPDHPSDRKFDAFSFLGGFSLGLGLVAIGFLSWKFYMSRQENVYHTL